MGEEEGERIGEGVLEFGEKRSEGLYDVTR